MINDGFYIDGGKYRYRSTGPKENMIPFFDAIVKITTIQ